MLKRIISFLILLPALSFAEPAQPLDQVVAIVNDNVITSSELETQADILRQQLSAQKMQVPPEAALRKQVLQHLIEVELQLQLAKKNDMSIDSTDLNEAINKIATTNKLTLSELREAVGKQGMNWESYRENIRKEMLISRISQNAVGKDIRVTPQQVEDFLKNAPQSDKSKQTFHLQNMVIPLPEEPTTEQLSKAKAKATLLLAKMKQGEDFAHLAVAEFSSEFPLEQGDLGERHLAELPDVFAKEVVEMKAGEVVGPLRTGNGYQLIKLVSIGGDDGHHQVVKTHVRHILLKQDANMTSAEALKQVHNLYEQLKSGKDFALMAKQYSLDRTSAVKGGDLGWVTEEELVPTFAKTMASLPLHVISQPVKSPFGWHLIEVMERKTVDDSKTFQRQQVSQFLQQRKFSEAVQNWLQHLRTDAYIKVMDKALA